MTVSESAVATLCPGGVYLIDEAQGRAVLEGEAFPAGYLVTVLDGEAAGSREGFFHEIARAMRFPDYFGKNWDAVYDCLTDLNWLPATGYVLLLDGIERLATDQPEQWAIGLKVLRDASDFWRPTRTPLLVLLRGPAALAPDVPPLPAECLAQ